jgi:hypothetical protein
MATASEEALRAIFEQIRDERKTHANTATRIGDAFLSLLSHLDNGTFLKQGDTESTEYILSVTGGASASLTKLFTLETVTEQGEERVTLATPLAPFKELELRDYLQIGDARLRWDSERQALYVIGKDGRAPVGFYSTGWISAKGANDSEGEGGGGGGLSYSRLDSWEGYSDEEKGGWVLSAYLGVRLYRDIENLKNGVAMSYAVQGTGNAITDVTRDGSRWVFTRGKTFSELWHTHTLSDISNLHSSWDAILKVAPSDYVTRWPTAAEVGALTQSAADSRYALKTVTISAGAGLTGGGNLSANRTLSLAAVGTAGTYTKVTVDAYGRVTAHASLSAADIPTLAISKISGLQAALDKKLEATAFTELFEKVTLADGTTAIRAKFGLYSDKWLSAKGANPNQGEGGGGISYSRLDTWEGYSDEEKGGWVLSAYLGVRLYRDIENLKSGVAMSYAVQGTGNAITDVTRDGSRWVFTKGKTFSELWHTHTLSDISNLHSSWDAVLKAQKPNWLTAVSLSTISDLHANWDAILKVAPSAYVTRWPTAAEVGALTQTTADGRYALKTVTISAGAGLTGGGNLSANRTLSLAAVGTAGTYTKVTVDAYGRVTAHASLSAADIPTLSISKISGLQAALDKKLEATAFTELFEKVTLSDGTVAIRAKYGLYSDKWLSAKGANPNQGEGGGGISYSRLDTWEGYSDEEKGGWVLSAYLGVRLHQDIENLKSGVAMSYAVQGTGNAITDVTRDGSRWVFTKGKTFSELGHTHPLSDISDLNSSWDSLLKEAPSAYITRWPSWTEVKDKPSTFTPSSHKHVKADITDFPATWAWSAISGKPTTFTPSAHQHPLSDISDLHSSWDAVLKAAPFAGVSRWPSWGEVTGKPTSFTPSSHTHAISQVSGLQAALDAKLPAATFEELFEKVTLSTGETAIRAKLGLYSDKWLSAKGANPNQGEGGGFSYTRLDTWEGYDSDTMDGWVLSAKLGYSLYNDVKSLKAGAAVSFTIQGTGNAITDISKDGTRLVFTRGTTFALASHQHLLSDISDLHSSWDAALKAQKPNWLTAVSLATISDLHSSWDALLKAAPSAYVTRWPTWSEVSGKPTTFTPASHTHTISQVSDLHASWDAILKAAPSGYVTRWPSIGEVTGKQSLAIKLNGGTTEGTNLFTYNGTAAKTVNITAASIGAPTKTGSGASGTWGISISGTAALATRLTPTEYGSGDLDALTHGSYATRFFYAAGGNTTANTPNGSDGFGLFVMRTAAGYTGQILMSPYGVLYTRYNGNNAWSAWRTVLDTDNYAATLDGRYLRTVSIATITDLHSSWDALLKAQKPTTLSGYGITDGVTTPAYTGSGNVLTAAAVSGHTITFTKGITAALASRKVNAGNGLTGGGTLTADITLNVASANAGISVNADSIQLNTVNALTSTDTAKPLSAAQGKKIWDFVTDLFEKVNIGTSSAPVYAIRAKYGLFSDGFVSGKGANPSAGEGGGTAYNRLDTWEGYTDELATWVLSAGLGYSLYNDVKNLKQGAAVSLVTTGSGNAVTDIAKSGTKLTVTKGLSFLTAHQNIFPLTIQGNGTSLGKYTPNSAAKTINITPASIGAAASSHTHSQYLTSVSLATISDLHSSWDAVLKVQKPNWLTAVSLATISDLHSSWDALLKAAPSAYVTRWPTAAEVGALTQSTADGRYVNITGDTMTGDLGIGNGRSSIDGSVPYCGSSGIGSKDLTELANYKTVLGAYTDKSGTWYALISVRHRNGFGDGNSYGLYLRSVLTAPGNLMWGKQYGSSTWQAERVILDSANYTSYTVTKTGGGASGTWGIGISGNAATASKWAAKRTISLTGAVTGSVSLDGSGNVSLATTYAAANISALDSRYVNVSGDTMTGLLSLSSGSAHKGARVGNVYVNAIDRALIIQNAKEIRFGQSDNWAYNDWGGLTYDHSKKYLYLGIADGTIFQQNAGALSGGSLLTPGIGNIFVGNNTSNKVWHAGNDGSGSGLDADLLDGTHKSGLFTAFSANGNSTRITIGGTTKDLTVPYAKNCDTLDGLHGSSFMACNGLNGISLTGGNGNTDGYRLVIQKTMTGWRINNLVFVVASRHNGQGILSVAFHITADSPSSYGYSIRYFGANFAMSSPFRAFYNTSTHVFRLYWHYRDYTSTAINVLRVEGFPSPSNGTWYEAMPSDNGTELTIEYNNADTLGGTSKGGLLTALSSSSGTNLSLTVGGTTKTVADLYATAAEKLLTARTINGTSFNGTANIVTSYWGTARNIAIASSNGGGAGAATSVNGSANVTLKLPATITAALSGNAATASKLQTARTLWGRSFDGSANVSGDLSGVGNISASGVFSTSKATNTYLAGNQGQALVNSTASAGAYVMLHRGCSTNGYFTLGTYQDKYLLQYTAKSTVTAGNNSVTKSLTLLNEAGNSTFPGTLYAKTGIYSDGYVSAKGQNTSSDMRLKDVLGSVTLPLERIAKAPAFEFRWRDGSGESAGSSAQYWKEALPSAVKERGGYLEMQYGNIALLSAISIARETMRVDREVTRLREECRRLRRRVARLEGAAGTRHLTAT